jgi:hypothetical protein
MFVAMRFSNAAELLILPRTRTRYFVEAVGDRPNQQFPCGQQDPE